MLLLRFPRAPFVRLLLFIGGAVLSITAGILVAAHFATSLGISQGIGSMALASAVIVALLLLFSAWLLRREGASLAALGLPMNRRRARDLVGGFAITAVLMLGVAVWQSAMVGGSWQFQGGRRIAAAGVALGLSGCMAFAEELVFRGVGFRYLRSGIGDWPAIIVSAVVFGGYHLIGSQNWGMGLALLFITPTLGGILFGWAAVRSGGLALPFGLHWGNNWVGLGIAGFTSASEATGPQALWRIPITSADWNFLMAPDPFPRLPYFLAIAVGAVLTGLFLRTMAKRNQSGVGCAEI